MFKIEMKVSGNLQDAVLRAYKKQIEDKVRAAVGADASSLRITLSGPSLQNLKIDIAGPPAAVEKAKKAIGAK